jgi:hypothetical protein
MRIPLQFLSAPPAALHQIEAAELTAFGTQHLQTAGLSSVASCARLQAGIMLEAVIKAITPKIMTWSQYAEAAWFMYQKKVMKNPAYKRYMPDYTKCMEHFALHAGELVKQRCLGIT